MIILHARYNEEFIPKARKKKHFLLSYTSIHAIKLQEKKRKPELRLDLTTSCVHESVLTT